ncbi:recombinase family protein [Actinocorallia populi]|uniref:recombinase family protein n=1 Tax=Actinocorallia populi TaxID=2079200 RepID=UPI000D090DD1|nr:recombinase family protein [Actinocorallia populi]
MTNTSTHLCGTTETVVHTTTPRALRAVDYLRVSTEEQRFGYGIASQARRNSRHIANKGWEHIGTYKDEGISGFKEMGERPDFDRLMEDAKLGGFDLVVVEKGDRIGRVGRAFWRWVWALEDMGIFVAITDRNIDNTTPEGQVQMRREADYAETERENIRSRTQGGLQEKAEGPGSPHIGGKPPYGYRIEGKGVKGASRLVIDEAEQAVVRRVHNMVVVDGLNLRQCAIRLNAEGITCRSGRPWSAANLRDRIMSRAVLDAELIFRGPNARTDADGRPLWGESVTISLPRVLSEDEAAALRRKVAARAKSSSRNRAVYPLTGRLIGFCTAPYTGISHESLSYGRRSYRCRGKAATVPGQEVCDCSYVDAEAVEKRVWSEIVTLLGDSRKLEALAAEWVGMSHGDQAVHAERIAGLDRQIDALKASTTAVILVSAKQQQPPDAIATATSVLNEELQQLEEMRAEAAAWLAEVEEADRRARNLKALAEPAQHRLADMTLEDQSEVLGLLNVKVFIEGPVPVRAGGRACTVQAWYRAAEVNVPATDLTDEQWTRVSHLLPTGRHDRVRRSVDAIFAKARTGASWPRLREEYGSPNTASKYFNKWVAQGIWDELDAALAEVARVPVPACDFLPPMRIEGLVDPRVILSAEERSRAR